VRSAQRRREMPIDELHEPSVAPRVNDPLLGELLRTLVAELAPDARIVVTLRFQEDLDMSEIAAITDMPVNTVKSHLRRSMDALRRRLKDKGHVYES
jgi:RNA polymerase sigma-70 factor (ECF subfamily)